MSRFPVIEGGPPTEGSESYADRFIPSPPSVEELRSRIELNIRHLHLQFAWFDERDPATFRGLQQSHAAFGRLLDDLGAALAAGES